MVKFLFVLCCGIFICAVVITWTTNMVAEALWTCNSCFCLIVCVCNYFPYVRNRSCCAFCHSSTSISTFLDPLDVGEESSIHNTGKMLINLILISLCQGGAVYYFRLGTDWLVLCGSGWLVGLRACEPSIERRLILCHSGDRDCRLPSIVTRISHLVINSHAYRQSLLYRVDVCWAYCSVEGYCLRLTWVFWFRL